MLLLIVLGWLALAMVTTIGVAALCRAGSWQDEQGAQVEPV